MIVVFDAEPLIAFAFDESGADVVEGSLDDVYDGGIDGVVPTVNLVEFRYVGTRRTSREAADAHIAALKRIGVSEYGCDDLWETASELKATYRPSLGDAYAVAAAKTIVDGERDLILLVGGDDDYDAFEEKAEFEGSIERFRDGAG